MKITSIVIENLGPYIDANRFNFSVDDDNKQVVLIGGKNGAGKTTLFNSIRIGLYGCRAYGFESNNAKYMEIVSQLINTTARINKKGRASVIISILMDDGKDNYTYTFERSWRLTTKVLHEELQVSRNGTPLSEVEKSDFQSYLLQLIPPDMFQFYFFDGESISNFEFNGINNTDFKNAFLKLCGLDTMELIQENFRRVSNMRKKDKTGAFEEYQAALNEQLKLDNAITEALTKKNSISDQLISIDEELSKSEQDFIQRGGISKNEYQSMQSQIDKEESKRKATRKWLKETANDILPFVILKDQLEKLKQQIAKEDQYQNSISFIECLNSTDVKEILFKALSDEGIPEPRLTAGRMIGLLSSCVETDSNQQILNLSKQNQLDILAKINSIMTFDVRSVRSADRKITSSLNRVKKIRQKMDMSDESGSDSFFARKDALIKQKGDALQSMLEIEREIDTLVLAKADISSKIKRAELKYEEFLKEKSVNDLTAKSLLAFGDIQKLLYRKYISDVEESFSLCFKRLINKSDLIDGIKIDDQLQVYPYKLKAFNRTSLTRLIKQAGSNAFIDQFGSIAYEAYLADNGNGDSITLPIEVKQTLSAGEKQIFIMALYQALSTLNKVSVPYVIDTPFARIDADHRQNILSNFFMNLKGQIIILSTDEEIIGAYRDSIDESVSNYYLLNHADNIGTKIRKNEYFDGRFRK